MALTGTDRGTGTHNTGATSFTLAPASNLAAGSWAVLCVSSDNAASGGAAFGTWSVTDTKGNTWTRRQTALIDPGAANAGQAGAIFTTDMVAGALTTGDTITVSFGSDSPVAKTWTLMEVVPGAAGETITYVTGNVGTGGTGTTSPTITTGSITNGDMVIAALFMEAGLTQAITQDSDTTNGSWSTQQTAEIGTTTSGSNIASQRKVVTATGTQTYNPTAVLSADLCLAWVQLHNNPKAAAGAGSDAVTVTETGAGKKAGAGAGSDAVVVSETAAASKAARGTATDAVAASEAAAGRKAAAGAGTALALVLAPSGTGAKGATGIGTVAELLTEAATGTASQSEAHSGDGTAAIAFAADGAGLKTALFTPLDSPIFAEASVGAKSAVGAGTDAVTLSEAAAGEIRAAGQGSDAILAAETAMGAKQAAGSGLVSPLWGLAVVAAKTAVGTASLAVGFTESASGGQDAEAHSGDGALALTFGLDGGGYCARHDATALAEAFSLAGAGNGDRWGDALAVLVALSASGGAPLPPPIPPRAADALPSLLPPSARSAGSSFGAAAGFEPDESEVG